MKLKNKDLLEDDLKNTEWVGIIEDNNDPLFKGRCKIRVFGKFDGKVNNESDGEFIIPTENLPWAIPSNNTFGGSTSGAGNFSIPKKNSIVRVTFDNGKIYTPIYHNNLNYSNELIEKISESYQNSHVLVYDTAFNINETGDNTREGEHIKILFTENEGLMIDYGTTEGQNIINIKPDNSLEIKNPNGDSVVMLNDGNITFTHSGKFIVNSDNNTEINCKNAIVNCENVKLNASTETHVNSPRIKLGEQAAESIMKGDTFKTIFDSHIHPTGVGPSGPPTQPSITQKYLSNKNTTD